MPANSQPATATIYQFPQRRPDRVREADHRRAGADERLTALPLMDYGAGWYHQAAVESERSRRN